VPYTEDEFVRRDMAKYASLYRVRAARALGEIGGADAARALDQALKLPLDPYVRTKVMEARAKIK
jgi:HEAT repeat protein